MPKVYSRPKLLDEPKLLEEPLELPKPTNGIHTTGVSHPPVEGEEDYLVKTLISWRAPARPFRKKDRSYYTTVATLVILISMIAILMGERLLIGALFAIAFVVYVLNFVPPEDIDHKLSTQGITIGDHFYHWDELDSFWFSEKEGHPILNVLTHLRFPGMLMLVLDGVDQENIKKVCATYLPFHEIPPRSLMDKWSEGLQKHFPLENPHH